MFVPITDPPGCVHGNCFEAYKRLRAENDERDRFLAQEDAEFDHERYQILNIPRPKVWSERHHGLIDAWTRPEGEHLDLPDDVWRLLAKHLVDEGGVSLFGNAGEVKWGQLTCGWNAVTTRWKPTRQCNLGNCGTLLARYVNRALWREMTRLMNERYEQWMERVHASERLSGSRLERQARCYGTVYNHPRPSACAVGVVDCRALDLEDVPADRRRRPMPWRRRRQRWHRRRARRRRPTRWLRGVSQRQR